MALLIVGATIIDGVAKDPIEGLALYVESTRISAIARLDDIRVNPGTKVVDARGKFVIPGLMDANVHLMAALRMEDLIRYEGRYEEVIAEAAQIALRSGLTTVFDTWGPRQPLMAVRDKIDSGQVSGSRMYCAGNIIGLDGPFSHDFFPKTLDVASPALVERINSLWAENVGPPLTWMTPDQVAAEVRTYIATGIDFIKYASSDHRAFASGPSAFLAFSPHVQSAMIEAAHGVGLTAQAHTTSVEALRVAIEAGCDIIQHANITAPTAIPSSTLRLLVDRGTASTVFPLTRRRYDWYNARGSTRTGFHSPVNMDVNVRSLIESGATLLLATDAGVFSAEAATDPSWAASASGEDNLLELGQGHFHWLKAMEEKGLAPMDGLKAATRNIAVAYRKDQDLGTLAPGKIADALILDKNPLEAAENYRSIHLILKEGVIVDRSALPTERVLTNPVKEASAEVLAYRANRQLTDTRLPRCC